jgi:hypothetical protein
MGCCTGGCIGDCVDILVCWVLTTGLGGKFRFLFIGRKAKFGVFLKIKKKLRYCASNL